MRILGVDYGDRYVGLALSDPTESIASPLMTIEREEEVNRRFARSGGSWRSRRFP